MVIFACCFPRSQRKTKRERKATQKRSSLMSSNDNEQDSAANAESADKNKTPDTIEYCTSAINKGKRPMYLSIDRSKSAMLDACWQQDWANVILLCANHPEQTFHRSENTGRTALHLVTMPGAACPSNIVAMLLETNPHAVLISDFHKYGGTPMHFVCGSRHRNNPQLIQLFCDAIIKMTRVYPHDSVRVDSCSPLYMATNLAAPPETLQILVDTGRIVNWVAPWTGAEGQLYNGSSKSTAFSRYSNTIPLADFRNYSPLRGLCRCRIFDEFTNIHSGDQLNDMRNSAISMLRDYTYIPKQERPYDEEFLQTATTTSGNKVLYCWIQFFVILRSGIPKDWDDTAPDTAILSRLLSHVLSIRDLSLDWYKLVFDVCNLSVQDYTSEGIISDNITLLPLHQVILQIPQTAYQQRLQESLIIFILEKHTHSLEHVCQSWYPAFAWAQMATSFKIASSGVVNTHLGILYTLLRKRPEQIEWQCQVIAEEDRGV